jgi:hypothetical protein
MGLAFVVVLISLALLALLAIYLLRLLSLVRKSGAPLAQRLSPFARATLRALLRAVLSGSSNDVDLSAICAPESKDVVRRMLQVVPDDDFVDKWLDFASAGVCEEHLRMQLALVLTLLGTRLGSFIFTRSWVPLPQVSFAPSPFFYFLRKCLLGSPAPTS